jgi:hypothetical protein
MRKFGERFTLQKVRVRTLHTWSLRIYVSKLLLSLSFRLIPEERKSVSEEKAVFFTPKAHKQCTYTM